MEKQTFGELFRRAWARSGDGRLMWLMFVNMLWGWLVMLPLFAVTGSVVFKAFRAKECGGEFPLGCLLWAIPAGIALLIAATWLMAAVNSGVMREVVYPAPARVGRAFRNGFARFLTVLFPIPWLLLASFVSGVQNQIAKLCDTDTLYLVPLIVLLWLVSVALNIVTHFLYCAVAAEDNRIGINDLYKNALKAFRNGWGRFLLGWLSLFGMGLACILALLPATICYLVGTAQENRRLAVVGIALFIAWCAGLFLAMLRLFGFSYSYNMYLYLDATGEPPETETASDAAAGVGEETSGAEVSAAERDDGEA